MASWAIDLLRGMDGEWSWLGWGRAGTVLVSSVPLRAVWVCVLHFWSSAWALRGGLLRPGTSFGRFVHRSGILSGDALAIVRVVTVLASSLEWLGWSSASKLTGSGLVTRPVRSSSPTAGGSASGDAGLGLTYPRATNGVLLAVILRGTGSTSPLGSAAAVPGSEARQRLNHL